MRTGELSVASCFIISQQYLVTAVVLFSTAVHHSDPSREKRAPEHDASPSGEPRAQGRPRHHPGGPRDPTGRHGGHA